MKRCGVFSNFLPRGFILQNIQIRTLLFLMIYKSVTTQGYNFVWFFNIHISTKLFVFQDQMIVLIMAQQVPMHICLSCRCSWNLISEEFYAELTNSPWAFTSWKNDSKTSHAHKYMGFLTSNESLLDGKYILNYWNQHLFQIHLYGTSGSCSIDLCHTSAQLRVRDLLVAGCAMLHRAYTEKEGKLEKKRKEQEITLYTAWILSCVIASDSRQLTYTYRWGSFRVHPCCTTYGIEVEARWTRSRSFEVSHLLYLRTTRASISVRVCRVLPEYRKVRQSCCS
jgi:hypothetical protein